MSCAGACCRCICALLSGLFAAGLVVLIYWAIFQPHQIRATVGSATLSNLTVSGNASSPAVVSYSLAANLSFYNPSVRVNIYYDAIDARLRFRDADLSAAANAATTTASPPEFYQRRKTRDAVTLGFDARGGVGVAGDVAAELEKEAKEGAAVRLELDVDVRVRYVFRIFKLRQKPRVRCSLSIPVKPEGSGAGAGVGGVLESGDRCRVKY